MTDKWAGVLWQRFKDLYGQKWLCLFQGDEAIESWRITWATGLQVGADQLKYALSRLSIDHPEWPPTFGQFKGLCDAMPKPYIALPPPQKIPRSDAVTDEFKKALQGFGSRNGPWWKPERVRNWAQANFIVLQAQRFGALSQAGQFLQECKEYGCISEDNQFVGRT